ncbi:hypothetical protein DFH28DRAFT_992606 [Melampsora americana]|nr:hypothetical protein DFH28DRAFT_992606 [Melampsora americana]
MSSHPYNTRLSARKRMLGEFQDDTVETTPTIATQGRKKRRRNNIPSKAKSSTVQAPDVASRSALSPVVASVTTSSEAHKSQSKPSGAASNLPSRTASPSRIGVSDSKRLKSTERCNILQSKTHPQEHLDPALRSPQNSHTKKPTPSPQNRSGTIPECDTESSCSFDASILIPAPSPDSVDNLKTPLATDQETEEQSSISQEEESNVEAVQDDNYREESTNSSLNSFWRLFSF